MEIQRLLEWFFAIVGAWAFCDIFAGMEINYPGEERQFRFLRKYLDTKYDILIFILCIVLWAALKNNS